MISLCACIVKTVIRLYTYPYRKRHMSLSRSIKFKTNNYKPPAGWKYRRELYNNVNVEVLMPKNCDSKYSIIQFHGGGYTVGMINLYHKIAEKYARLCGYTVYSIDYMTANNLRHPSLLNDTYNACIGLINSGLDMDNVIAVGDSMGANLMMATCFKLRDNGIMLPHGLIAISPAVDLAASGESYRMNCYKDPLYSLPKFQKYADNVSNLRRITPYGDGCDLYNPYLSPAFGDYYDFPSVLIQCGDCEISMSDSDMLYQKLILSQSDVQLIKYRGMFHNFQYLTPFLRESKAAWKDIQCFINRLTEQSVD